MTPKQRRRMLSITLLLFVAVSVVGLTLYALTQNINLFYTPTQVLRGDANMDKPHIGQPLRAGGMVSVGSVKREENTLTVRFSVYDLTGVVDVEYTGILPDLFREGQAVVVDGVLVAAGRIQATSVLAKHDETYMAPEVAEAMNVNHQRLKGAR